MASSDFETIDGADGNTPKLASTSDHPTVKLLQQAIKAIEGQRWSIALDSISGAASIIMTEQDRMV